LKSTPSISPTPAHRAADLARVGGLLFFAGGEKMDIRELYTKKTPFGEGKRGVTFESLVTQVFELKVTEFEKADIKEEWKELEKCLEEKKKPPLLVLTRDEEDSKPDVVVIPLPAFKIMFADTVSRIMYEHLSKLNLLKEVWERQSGGTEGKSRSSKS